MPSSPSGTEVVTGYATELVGFATISAVHGMTVVKTTYGALRGRMSDDKSPEAEAVGQIIQEWREDRRYTRPALVRALRERDIRTTADYLAKLELGYRDFSRAGLELREGIREALQIDRQEWREKTGLFVPLGPGEAMPQPRSTPLQGDQTIVPLGRRINVYAAGTGPAWDLHDILEVVYLPEGMYPNQDVIGLKAMGDSMEPYLPKGDIAVVALDDGLVAPGDYCGVWLSDDGVVIKRFVQELPHGELLLESLNPDEGETKLFTAPAGSRVMGKVDHRILKG